MLFLDLHFHSWVALTATFRSVTGMRETTYIKISLIAKRKEKLTQRKQTECQAHSESSH